MKTQLEWLTALRNDVVKLKVGDTQREIYVIEIDAILNGQSFNEANAPVRDQKALWRRIGLGSVNQ